MNVWSAMSQNPVLTIVARFRDSLPDTPPRVVHMPRRRDSTTDLETDADDTLISKSMSLMPIRELLESLQSIRACAASR